MDASYLADFMELNVSLMLRILHLVISCALPRRLNGAGVRGHYHGFKSDNQSSACIRGGGTIIANFPQTADVFLIGQVVDV